MSSRGSGARHQLRRVALQVLYAVDLGQLASSGAPSPCEEVFDRVAANFDLPAGAHAFAKTLVCGTVDCSTEIDALVAAHAENWRISRMAVLPE